MKTLRLKFVLDLVRVIVNVIYIFVVIAVGFWVVDYFSIYKAASSYSFSGIDGYARLIIAFIFAEILGYVELSLREKYL